MLSEFIQYERKVIELHDKRMHVIALDIRDSSWPDLKSHEVQCHRKQIKKQRKVNI